MEPVLFGGYGTSVVTIACVPLEKVASQITCWLLLKLRVTPVLPTVARSWCSRREDAPRSVPASAGTALA